MSSRNNDEVNGMMFAIALIGAIIVFMAAVVYAMAAFAAIVLTLFAIAAWNEPLTLNGNTLQPEEARIFVLRGVVGAVFCPVFLAFCDVLFAMHVNWSLWPHFVLGGYTAGSVGFMIFCENTEEPQNNAQVILPPAPRLPEPPRTIYTPPEPKPFRFASWDDEEERG
jgi:hypothetical protein